MCIYIYIYTHIPPGAMQRLTALCVLLAAAPAAGEALFKPISIECND